MAARYFDWHRSLLDEVRAFNEGQLSEHAATPRGVGWNSPEAQEIRFDQLLKVVHDNEPNTASLNDIGCGYGALLPYLARRGKRLNYRGFELSQTALALAKELHAGRYDVAVAFAPMEDITPATYCVGSGLFALRFGRDDTAWLTYIQDTLDVFHENSSRGFAFNMLTSYSDPEKKVSHLYYAHPCEIFDLCKRRYSKNVALYHDYSLYDFTIIVRKDRSDGTAT